MRSATVVLVLSWLVISAAGCGREPAVREEIVSTRRGGGDGVVLRQFSDSGSLVSVLDVDLQTPGIGVQIFPRQPQTSDDRLVPPARSVADWLAETGALAGINGGFFGAEDPSGRKEVLGLFVQEGRALTPAPPTRSRSRNFPFARSCFGLTAEGEPWIAWASAAEAGAVPVRHPSPEVRLEAAVAWPVAEAIGCGPRLLHEGRRLVTDRQERLVSDGPLPRTFIGYSTRGGRPRRLALATATGLTFDGCARVLTQYFRRHHGETCREAMALDGGSSSQMAYRQGEDIREAQAGLVTIPSAVLVRDAKWVLRVGY